MSTGFIIEPDGIVEPSKKLAVIGKYDVIVAGGGPAGFGAAVANLEAVNAHWHRNSDPEKHKLILDRMLKESGSDLLLTAQIVDAVVKDNRICGVVIESKSGRQAVLADRVIDCTGDADVAHFAGCECFEGRPEDGKHQACSLDFRLGGADWDKYLESDFKKNDPVWIDLIQKAVDNGDLPYMIENHVNWITHVPGRPQHCGKDEICFCISHSRNCDPLSARDLTRMYQEGREQADIFSRFIRRFIPGFENSYLIDTGMLLGVRESRRVEGLYKLCMEDFENCSRFPDAVARCSYNVDIHSPRGAGTRLCLRIARS